MSNFNKTANDKLTEPQTKFTCENYCQSSCLFVKNVKSLFLQHLHISFCDILWYSVETMISNRIYSEACPKIICGRQNYTAYNEICSNIKLSSLVDRSSALSRAFLKSLFLMTRAVYLMCYVLHVQILYTNLESIYHTSHKHPKLLDIITLSYPFA